MKNEIVFDYKETPSIISDDINAKRVLCDGQMQGS